MTTMAPSPFVSLTCSFLSRKPVCLSPWYPSSRSVVLPCLPSWPWSSLSICTREVLSPPSSVSRSFYRSSVVSFWTGAPLSSSSLSLATSVSSAASPGLAWLSSASYASSSRDLVPLAKLCADRNLCSRHEAEHFAALGLISVDGKPVETDRRVFFVRPTSHVELLPRAQRVMDAKVTVLLNKPLHFLSCQADRAVNRSSHCPV